MGGEVADGNILHTCCEATRGGQRTCVRPGACAHAMHMCARSHAPPPPHTHTHTHAPSRPPTHPVHPTAPTHLVEASYRRRAAAGCSSRSSGSCCCRPSSTSGCRSCHVSYSHVRYSQVPLVYATPGHVQSPLGGKGGGGRRWQPFSPDSQSPPNLAGPTQPRQGKGMRCPRVVWALSIMCLQSAPSAQAFSGPAPSSPPVPLLPPRSSPASVRPPRAPSAAPAAARCGRCPAPPPRTCPAPEPEGWTTARPAGAEGGKGDGDLV